ncbi:MAG: LmbE family protein, partial [Candidatus Saccharibacteria bacterium]|nr:LmbE family protein [Candidatus Saccharibacteria bacterium]
KQLMYYSMYTTYMKKIIFGIFAHPDDEAFGPSGTLLLETRQGTELHLVTLTAGENGTNPDGHERLGDVRLEEWKKAGALIGATSLHHFGYEDGTLNNLNHIEITQRIESLVIETIGSQSDIEIEMMSIDLNGVTGHIDHIVASRSAVLAFYRLKAKGYPLTRIRLSCVPYSQLPNPNTSFVLMEAGHNDKEINEVVDATAVLPEIYQIIRAHHTQRDDGQRHIENLGDGVAINSFIILT